MAGDTRHLRWEGPAGRTIEQFLPLTLDSARKESGGLFGIRLSPSLAGALPDPTILTLHAEAGGEVTARVPGGELPELAPGDRLVLGVIGDACICVLKPPAGIAYPEAWAKTQVCK